MKPDPQFRTGQVNAKGKTICGAKNRQGKPCGNTMLYPNGRCKMHGGPTPNGPDSPAYKHGEYSKYAIPQRLLGRFTDYLNDPDLMSLNQDVALLTTRRDELLMQLDQKDTGAAWKSLKTTYNQLQTAFRERDTVRASALLAEMERVINTGVHDSLVWKEIQSVEEQRVKTVDTWFGQSVKSESVIPISHMMWLVGQLIQAVRDNVHDRDAVEAIAQVADRALLEGGR